MKQVTPFKHHIDNAKEVVSASHMNKVQEAINNVEQEQIVIADRQFRQQAFFALETSVYANSMFLDDLQNPYKIFMAQSTNIVFDSAESCIKLANNGTINNGEMMTVKLSSQYPTAISEFGLVVDEYIPKGAALKYYISADGKSYFPIKPNISEPLKLVNAGNEIFLKVQFIKNRNYESPKLFGWCILYRDPVVDRMHSLGHIELSKLDGTVIGETMLFRNNKADDRLEVIVTPSGLTELYYDSTDENGEPRLSHILERNEDKIIKQTMNYGPYTNAEGVDEDVLLSITTSLEKVEDAETESGSI